MYIKYPVGDGQFKMHYARRDVQFMGHNIFTEDPNDFPKAEVTMRYTLDGKYNMQFHWVKFTDEDGIDTVVVTNGPIYIVNDDGRTIENLRDSSS